MLTWANIPGRSFPIASPCGAILTIPVRDFWSIVGATTVTLPVSVWPG